MDNAPEKMDYSPVMAGKSSGFPGQRLVVVHPPQRDHALRLELLRSFCPTDIGFFPSAKGHERRRPFGSPQTIFIHCLEGGGWCEIAGARHAIGPRDLLVIPPRAAHAYGASVKHPWSIEWFHVAGTGVPEILRRLGTSRRAPVLSLQPGVWDSDPFNEALSTLEAGFTDSHILHAALTLGHLLGRIIIRQKGGGADPSSLTARLEKVAAFLREDPARSVSVPQMAAMAGLSLSHFAELFLKHIGHSPMDYLIRVRMGRACHLLDFTTLSVKEIAAKVGYSDPYYFSRVFKKITSSSPRAYRETHKG